MILSNKHVVIAMIVAPILAIIAYFATDNLVSEKPHSAVAGQSYPLVAKPNCRYASGRCSLKNGDIELELLASTTAGAVNLQLQAQQPLQGAKIALATAAEDSEPRAMSAVDGSNLQWQLSLSDWQNDDLRLLLVVSINDSLYFADTEARFIQ